MRVKPGYLTTEFWGTVLLNIGVVATALSGSLPPKYAALLSTISAGAYTAARTLTKASAHIAATKKPSPPQS